MMGEAVEAEEAVPFMLNPVAVGTGELWLVEGLNGAAGGVVAAEEAAAEAFRRALRPIR